MTGNNGTALLEIPAKPAPKRRTLFEIGADGLALMELLEEVDGDISDPVAAAAVFEWFAELEHDRDAKLESCAWVERELLASAQARKAESVRLAELAKVDTNKAQRLHEMVKRFFQIHSLTKIKTHSFNFSLSNAGGKAAMTIDEGANPASVPLQFVKSAVYTFDTDAIREFLEAGGKLDFARLEPKKQVLGIK